MLYTDISPWCQSDDPVVRSACLTARVVYLGAYDDKTVGRLIARLDEILSAANKEDPYLDPDTPRNPVEVLVDTHALGWRPYEKLGASLEDILALLILHEAVLGNYGTAVKAHERLLRQQAETLRKSKGGKAPKRKAAIWRHTLRLIREDRKLTVREAWSKFPDPDDPWSNDEGYTVYRDGDKLVQALTRKKKRSASSITHEGSIGFSTFQRYVTDARKQIE
jgi:hypothetical protein